MVCLEESEHCLLWCEDVLKIVVTWSAYYLHFLTCYLKLSLIFV